VIKKKKKKTRTLEVKWKGTSVGEKCDGTAAGRVHFKGTGVGHSGTSDRGKGWETQAKQEKPTAGVLDQFTVGKR